MGGNRKAGYSTGGGGGGGGSREGDAEQSYGTDGNWPVFPEEC